MLSTLSEKVDPQHSALILVDVQNDFCAEGGAMHREGRDLSLVKRMMPAARAAARCGARRQGARASGSAAPTIPAPTTTCPRSGSSRRSAAATAPMSQFPVCEPGEWNGDFFQVRPLPDEVIVTKHRYGAFEGTDLDLVLRSRGIRSVIMTGVATNVCVETTARQAFLQDYYVVFTSDCTRHLFAGRARRDALQHRQFFGEVVTSERDHGVLAGRRVAAARGVVV